MKQKYAVGDKVKFTETKGGYSAIKDTGVVTEILSDNLVECEVTYSYGFKKKLSFYLDEIAGKIE